jgi:glycosyltransferase involved in cell wall biosynthesis
VKYKITVAIPTRNRPEKLFHALRSCSAQVHSGLQFLIIDNNSESSTYDIISPFLLDPRFKYKKFHESASINEQFARCVIESDGEWLTIIGDDDCLYPDFSDIICNVIDTACNSMDLISWELGQYRWPCFGSDERNRLSIKGQASRGKISPSFRTGNAREFLSLIEHEGIKSIYNSPGIYHRACRKQYVAQLVSRFGFEHVFKHSPDISLQVHSICYGASFLHLYSPLTLAGYSSSSTGAAFASNDSSRYVKRYLHENPGLLNDLYELFPVLKSDHSPVFSEVLGSYIIMTTISSMYSVSPPSLASYIKSEISNGVKLAPSLRKPMQAQLEKIAISYGFSLPLNLMDVFNSCAPSRSLSAHDSYASYQIYKENPLDPSNPEPLTMIALSQSMDLYGIDNVYDAAMFSFLAFLRGPALRYRGICENRPGFAL